MKLSHRLNSLRAMIQGQYDHIWDCCCDHGLLGAALLTQLRAQAEDINGPHHTQVHFVDIIPSLMQEVADKLQRFYPQSKHLSSPQTGQGASWQVHCLDVSQLPLVQDNSSNLIIIAGVGGDLTLSLVQAIHGAHPDRDLDFLLCPVHHHFQLRQGLDALGYGLIDEGLVTENRRFYELIYVSSRLGSSSAARPIHPVGDKLWQQDLALSQAYVARTLAHYGKMQRSGKNTQALEGIIQAYRQVSARLI